MVRNFGVKVVLPGYRQGGQGFRDFRHRRFHLHLRGRSRHLRASLRPGRAGYGRPLVHERKAAVHRRLRGRIRRRHLCRGQPVREAVRAAGSAVIKTSLAAGPSLIRFTALPRREKTKRPAGLSFSPVVFRGIFSFVPNIGSLYNTAVAMKEYMGIASVKAGVQ